MPKILPQKNQYLSLTGVRDKNYTTAGISRAARIIDQLSDEENEILPTWTSQDTDKILAQKRGGVLQWFDKSGGFSDKNKEE